MQITEWRTAGRRYRVATGIASGVEPAEAARELQAEAAPDTAGLVVVTPPGSEKDTALGLHAFAPDGRARPVDGLEAMCGFRALAATTHPGLEATEFRFGDRAVAVFGGHREAARVELDLGKPRMDPAESHLRVEGLEVIEPPHTLEIPLIDADESVIATLVGLAGSHAVMFTEDLAGLDLARVGESLGRHGIAADHLAVHAVAIEQPGWVRMRCWDGVGEAGEASAFGLGAVCAAGVTMCCTTETNAVRLPEGELSAAWDGDGHVRVRGRVEAV